ncbi:dockerin type I repeat-containing protein [Ruminococcus sp.]|uniref:dockerin type I repeat-containing protein n=1 Tax=Ruminococcus sp. TaxID=41978 RepID=UPI002D0B2CE2|nr:dockerin type I repeat-containing protein [Ruminococcus sp.]HNZ99382.1 dockerin type I repeat-containing protein [Ruminococcus sp.]HOH86534.1 dockerin type I repeat-containing protein [Ruminococcus sp.]
MKIRKMLAALAALCIAVPVTIAGQAGALTLAPVVGDVNSDFTFNLADMVMYQRWLKGAGKLIAETNGDVNGDGTCDVLDLSAMRSSLSIV